MNTKLLLPFLLLFKNAIGTSRTEFNHVTVRFEKEKVTDVTLTPYLGGFLSKPIIPLSETEYSRIYLIPKDILPCELSLQYKYLSFCFEKKILLSNSSLKLAIDPSKDLVNWNGNIENIISEKFQTNKSIQFNKIISFRLSLKNCKNDLKELKEQKEKYQNICIKYNQWIDSQIKLYYDLWISELWAKEKIPLIQYNENPQDQYRNLLMEFSQHINYKNNSIMNTSYYYNFLYDYIVRVEILSMLSSQDGTLLHNKYAKLLLNQVFEKNKTIHNTIKNIYTNILETFKVKLSDQ